VWLTFSCQTRIQPMVYFWKESRCVVWEVRVRVQTRTIAKYNVLRLTSGGLKTHNEHHMTCTHHFDHQSGLPRATNRNWRSIVSWRLKLRCTTVQPSTRTRGALELNISGRRAVRLGRQNSPSSRRVLYIRQWHWLSQEQ